MSAMKLYPKGPWKAIADHIATRSVRQVQTHAQKYQEKVSRRLRGLRKSKKKLVRPEHRIDDETMELCKLIDSAAKKLVVVASPRIVKQEMAAVATKAAVDMNMDVVKAETAVALVGTDVASPVDASSKTSNVLDLDAALKTDDDLQPLPFADFEDIELDPVHFPTVSESLDFLIEYLSV